MSVVMAGRRCAEREAPRDRARRELDILAELTQKDQDGDFVGGVVAESRVDPETRQHYTMIHIGDPFEPEKGIVTLPSRLTLQEVHALRNQTIWTEEFCEILHAAAKAKAANRIFLCISDSSLGKTFAIDRLTELQYGAGNKPEDFYCQKQTEAAELLGRWVPHLEDPGQRQRVMALLDSAPFRARAAGKDLESSDQAVLARYLCELSLDLGLSQDTRWEYELGALFRAAILELMPNGARRVDVNKPGAGFPLHIQELGLAQAGVVNALLLLGGEHGALASALQLPGDAGRTLLAGPEFWVALSSNSADGVGMLQREAFGHALLSRLVTWQQVEPIKRRSYETYARKFFTYTVGNLPAVRPDNCKLPIYEHRELALEMADLMAVLHEELQKRFAPGEPGRAQSIEVTLRDMARMADYVLHFQKASANGLIDMAATIESAANEIYLARLAAPELQDPSAPVPAAGTLATLRETAAAHIKEVLYGSSGEKSFRGGELKTRAEIFKTLAAEAARSEEMGTKIAAAEREIVNKLKQRRSDYEHDFVGGVVIEQLRDPLSEDLVTLLHFGNPHEETPEVITLRSRISQEQAEELRDTIVWTAEFCELFTAVIKAYKTGSVLILEGDKSTGKTFAIEKLVGFLYGKDADGSWVRPEELYCNQQTEACELLGTYVPKIPDAKKRDRIQRILEGPWGLRQFEKLHEEIALMGDYDADEQQQLIKARLLDITRTLLLADDTQWEYQYGKIPFSMKASISPEGRKVLDHNHPGHGIPLHIQEINRAQPGVSATVLQLGGQHGKVARRIQIFSDSGEIVMAGDEFWTVLSINPPESEDNTNPIDAALDSRCIHHRLQGGMSKASCKLMGRRFMSYSVNNRPAPAELGEGCKLELYRHPELCLKLGEIVGEFHHRCIAKVKEARPLSPDRQLIDPSFRTMGSLAAYVLQHQAPPGREEIDLAATLKNAVQDTYCAGIKDKDLRAEILKLIGVELAKHEKTLRILVHNATALENEQAPLAPQDEELRAAEQDQAAADYSDILADLGELLPEGSRSPKKPRPRKAAKIQERSAAAASELRTGETTCEP